MRNRRFAWLDNPIFVKHLRSRLRLQPLISSMVVVLVLGLCIAWAGYVRDVFGNGEAFKVLLVLQSIILIIIGAIQVGGSVGGARETGILDFHRVSPLSPTFLTLGFFLGAPVREYVLFAGTLPFSLFCVVMGAPDFWGFLQIMILLIVSTWIFHGLTLILALIAKKPKQATQAASGMLVIILMFFGGLLTSGVDRAVLEEGGSPRLSFFGVPLPWLLVVLLYEVPTLFFLVLAARRKMDSERAHASSKPQAVAALATLTMLVLGGLWGVPSEDDSLVLVVLYVLVAVTALLIPAVTPNLGEYAKGIRRAEKLGGKRVGLWHDLALNRLVLFALCGIVLVGATVASSVIPGRRMLDGATAGPSSDSLPIAIGVLVLAYYGLALQFFQLAFPRRASTFFGLFLFLAWLVPVLAGTIISAARIQTRGELGMLVFALSPVAGIALSSHLGGSTGTLPVQAAALCPALIFTFLFNNLVTRARRRADRALHAGPERSEPARLVDLEPAPVSNGSAS